MAVPLSYLFFSFPINLTKSSIYFISVMLFFPPLDLLWVTWLLLQVKHSIGIYVRATKFPQRGNCIIAIKLNSCSLSPHCKVMYSYFTFLHLQFCSHTLLVKVGKSQNSRMSQINKWSNTSYLGFLISKRTWFCSYLTLIFNLE